MLNIITYFGLLCGYIFTAGLGLFFGGLGLLIIAAFVGEVWNHYSKD